MAEAGEESPHLDQKEQRHAAAGAPMGALVIHEIVRDQGEEELDCSFGGLAWSGLAAGLSIGFSFLVQATPQANLPDAPWRPLKADVTHHRIADPGAEAANVCRPGAEIVRRSG
jgi:hypothetical protein